ncbi:TspO and MBR related proteins [Flavobacterium swingsii]|jgi:benzodiazapine receptor|uniref:TspO and MBR related proteins n=1 Tax=Flavobacterium swingsii TaxID=498292 RepID=A0A1I0WWR0_9FLAO|nr:TspO and MBR related proteins [Flavobacterium swingsii]
MSTTKNIQSTVKLVISILTCQLVGMVTVFSTQPESNYWYNRVVIPFWKFPIYFFDPVWTILYFLMGISIWMIWISGKHKSMKKYTILIFGIQLFLSALWSLLFFNFHAQSLALFIILLLVVFLAFCIIEFFKISKMAAFLLVPSLLWVCFEAVLNFKILFLSNYNC